MFRRGALALHVLPDSFITAALMNSLTALHQSGPTQPVILLLLQPPLVCADTVVKVLNSSAFKDDNGDGQQYCLPASRKRSCVVAQACNFLHDIAKSAEGCAQALQAGAVPTLTQTIERHRLASQVCHLSALRALRQIADTVAREGAPSLSSYQSQLQDAAPTVRESMSVISGQTLFRENSDGFTIFFQETSDGHTKREGNLFLESVAGGRPITRVVGAGQKRRCTGCSLM